MTDMKRHSNILCQTCWTMKHINGKREFCFLILLYLIPVLRCTTTCQIYLFKSKKWPYLVKIVHRQRNYLLPKLFIFCFLLLFSLAGFMAGSDLTQQNGLKHNLGHEILDVAIVICVKFYLRSLSYLLRCRNTAKIQLKVLMFKFSSNQLMVNHVFPCYRIFVQTHGLSRWWKSWNKTFLFCRADRNEPQEWVPKTNPTTRYVS